MNIGEKIRSFLISAANRKRFEAESALIEALGQYEGPKEDAICAEDVLKKIYWVIPPFENPNFGGPMSIFRLARAFDIAGYYPHFLKAGHGGVSKRQIESIGLEFSKFELDSFDSPEGLQSQPPAFAAFATFWTTAYQVASMGNVIHRGYLIQDWEPGFYPAGSLSSMAKGTYRLGLTHVVNTESLARIIDEYSGSLAISFLPTVDKDLFKFDLSRVERPKQVVAYWRPTHNRNCSEIILETIKLVHDLDPEITINLVGEAVALPKSSISKSSRIKLMGVLTPAETARLYSRCRAGITLMDTPHPSYLPFELMASGAIPVSTYNPATSWLLKNNHNALIAEAGPRELARCVVFAMQDLHYLDDGIAQTIKSLPNWHDTMSDTAQRILKSWQSEKESKMRAGK